ncbi:MAG: hemin receptor [Ignavibacteriales bacterium]|nr:hemin receptor [Ignavibacteriales bacterium]
MTPQQQALVRTTFEQVKPRSTEIADLLYKKLFELEPKTVALFRGDMKEQKEKLMRMLQIAIEGIDDHAQLQPMLFNLGRIHHSYGVQGHQFMSFQESLMFALKTVLGKDFTPEVEQAWRAIYLYFASTMHNFPHHEENVQVPHN